MGLKYKNSHLNVNKFYCLNFMNGLSDYFTSAREQQILNRREIYSLILNRESSKPELYFISVTVIVPDSSPS